MPLNPKLHQFTNTARVGRERDSLIQNPFSKCCCWMFILPLKPSCLSHTQTPTFPPTKHLPTTHTHTEALCKCVSGGHSYNHQSCWRLHVICVDISKKQVQSEATATKGLHVRQSCPGTTTGVHHRLYVDTWDPLLSLHCTVVALTRGTTDVCV